MATISQILQRITTTVKDSPPRNITPVTLRLLLSDIVNFLQDSVNQILLYNNFKPIHSWNGTKLKLQNPNGTYGPEVDLRGPLPNLGLVVGKNLFNPLSTSLTANKAVDTGGNGQIYDFANYISSEYMPVVAGDKYTFSGMATTKGLRFEDAARALVSGASLSGSAATTVTVPANAVWMIFTVKTTSESVIPATIQVEKSAVVTSFQPYQTVVTQIENSPIKASLLADNTSLAVVGNNPDSVMNKAGVQAVVAAGLPSFGLRMNPNLFNPANVQMNVAINLGGNGTIYNNFPNWISSEWMPVVAGEKYTFSNVVKQRGIRFENAARALVSGAVAVASGASTVTVPATAVWMCFAVKDDTEASIPATFQVEKGTSASSYNAYGTGQLHSINGNPLVPYYYRETTGLKFLIFGDSIATMWPQYIQMPYWGKVDSFATSSAWIKDKPGATVASESFSVQLQMAIDQAVSPDVIGIFLGTNDSFSSNIGTYETAMAKATLADLDRAGSLYESLRYHYWKISTQWPNAKVFHATPLQRADRTIDQMKTITDAIKRMAATYCVRVIDAEAESGIIRQFEVAAGAGRYLTDGVHPGTDGRKMLADYYMKRIIRGLV
ncbi:SGNH/GDSL hydrolase family protein [Spirosoma endbachense]|uniref:SGNH hydrolase-type esterase domain-containing protein n=1 Tax=Spirosoma endbachense TaxID=2666025 RepID=A0A6P1W0Y2_9BACT|nr:SGNH/GDSL hydrolase family protein [Spirosoma endbachense]QHV97962.1 hypothetical protein GJR95_24430 [Spirosoma endbachense]